MDFRIVIDISERLEKSLQDLTSAIFSARVFPTPEECRAKYFADVDPEAEYVHQENAENLPVETPKEPEVVNTPSEPESIVEMKSEQPVEAKPEAVEVVPQNDNGKHAGQDDTGIEAVKSWVRAVASEQPEKKPAKKRTSKKAESLTVETPKESAPLVTPAEPENTVETKSEQPAEVKPESSEPKTPDDDDPMCGMTVMDAMQAVMSEISEKGLEMADVNARVRARAAEAGIAYSSIICLIKAIGYKEARRVALGEK